MVLLVHNVYPVNLNSIYLVVIAYPYLIVIPSSSSIEPLNNYKYLILKYLLLFLFYFLFLERIYNNKCGVIIIDNVIIIYVFIIDVDVITMSMGSFVN